MKKNKSNNGDFLRLLEFASQIPLTTAIREMIDDSIDADAKNISITLDSNRSIFSIVDDGHGMTYDQLCNFRENYHSHNESPKKTIGIFGVGLKDSILKLSNYNIGANVTIKSGIDRDNVCYYRFEVNKNKENAWHDTPPVEGPYTEKNWHAEHGHMVSIDGIKPIPKSDRQWHANLNKSISTAYPYLINKNNINIKINGEDANCVDRMYLSHLCEYANCDDVYNVDCGIYDVNGLIYWVKTYKLVNKYNRNDEKRVKVIFLYISSQGGKKINDRAFEFSGMFSMFRGRYIDFANHKIGFEGLKATTSMAGGSGSIRGLIFIDDNEDILAIDANKKSIDLNNEILDHYVIDNDKNLSNAFKDDFNKLLKLNNYQSDGTKNKFSRPIDAKVAKTLLLTKTTAQALIKASLLVNKKNDLEDSEKELEIAESSIENKENNNQIIYTPVSSSVENAKEALKNMENEDVIKYHKNKTTGVTEFTITEAKPATTSDRVITVLAETLLGYSGKTLNTATQKKIINEFAHKFAI